MCLRQVLTAKSFHLTCSDPSSSNTLAHQVADRAQKGNTPSRTTDSGCWRGFRVASRPNSQDYSGSFLEDLDMRALELVDPRQTYCGLQ